MFFKRCNHKFYSVGSREILVGLDTIETYEVLYCPKCGKEKALSYYEAKIELEKQRLRESFYDKVTRD